MSSVTINDTPIETEELKKKKWYDTPLSAIKKFGGAIQKGLEQQERNAASADLFNASQEAKGNVEMETPAGKALVDANVKDMKEGSGFKHTNEALEGKGENAIAKKAVEHAVDEVPETTAPGHETITKAESDQIDKTVEETNPSAPLEEKAKSSYKLKSILQAYHDGDIDEGSRDYLIANTLSTFARNLGRDMGNVAAAYSGGTMNNERDEDLWSQRNERMANQAITSEEAGVEGSDKAMERAFQRIKLSQNQYQLKAAENLNRLYKTAKTETERMIISQLMGQVASGQFSNQSMLAMGGLGAISDLTKLFGKGDK